MKMVKSLLLVTSTETTVSLIGLGHGHIDGGTVLIEGAGLIITHEGWD